MTIISKRVAIETETAVSEIPRTFLVYDHYRETTSYYKFYTREIDIEEKETFTEVLSVAKTNILQIDIEP